MILALAGCKSLAGGGESDRAVRAQGIKFGNTNYHLDEWFLLGGSEDPEDRHYRTVLLAQFSPEHPGQSISPTRLVRAAVDPLTGRVLWVNASWEGGSENVGKAEGMPIGDIDADGVADLWVCRWQLLRVPGREVAWFSLISGRTGVELASAFPEREGPTVFCWDAVPDVTGDGVDDLVMLTGTVEYGDESVTASSILAARVINGLTGETVMRSPLFSSGPGSVGPLEDVSAACMVTDLSPDGVRLQCAVIEDRADRIVRMLTLAMSPDGTVGIESIRGTLIPDLGLVFSPGITPVHCGGSGEVTGFAVSGPALVRKSGLPDSGGAFDTGGEMCIVMSMDGEQVYSELRAGAVVRFDAGWDANLDGVCDLIAYSPLRGSLDARDGAAMDKVHWSKPDAAGSSTGGDNWYWGPWQASVMGMSAASAGSGRVLAFRHPRRPGYLLVTDTASDSGTIAIDIERVLMEAVGKAGE